MKVTKKAIKAAPRYIMTLDPKTGSTNDAKAKGFYKSLSAELYFKALTATSLIEAMAEAESYCDETTFMITLAEKTGEADIDTEGIIYSEVLAGRGNNNWHICDEKHGETAFLIAYNTEYKFFQLIDRA